MKDFGAVGDGATDDATAINNAIAYAKTTYYNNGIPFELRFPSGNFLVKEGINLTGFVNRGVQVEGLGSIITGQTNGKAVIDGLGSLWLHLNNITVFGSATLTPSIGIQIGRTAASSGAANQSWSHIMVYGSYTFAGVYNFSSETSNFTDMRITNNYGGGTATSCFGLVLDGVNHWNVPSDYTTTGQTTDTYHSFNENLFLQPQVQASFGCTPVWMANTRRHRWVGGYIADGTGVPGTTPAASPYGVILYSIHNTAPIDNNTMLDMDTHFETSSLQDEFFITGPNATPDLTGLKRREHNSNATNFIFQTDTNITQVTLPATELVYSGLISSVLFFSDPTLWTVAGEYFIPQGSSAWNLPSAQFGGVGMTGFTTTLAGDGSALTGVTATTPSNLQAASVSNTGGVASIAVTAAGHYDVDTWCFHTGTPCNPAFAHLAPTVSLPTPLGGSPATAAVTALTFGTNTVLDPYTSGSFILPITGGTGYAVNDQFEMTGSSGCTTAPIWRVVSIGSGGSIATYGIIQPGSCPITGIVAEPITAATHTGAGSGATFGGLTWQVQTIGVTTSGAGYGTAPIVTIQASSVSPTTSASATSTTNASLALSSGQGAVSLTPTGTKLGTLGTSGGPLVDLSAIHDGATTFVTSVTTGATQTMAVNSDNLVLENASVVAAQTVLLPPITTIAGQSVTISSLGGVTTATFQTSAGGTITGAPVSLGAISSRKFISDGTNWFPVQ